MKKIISSTIVALSLLAGAQSASAGSVTFYQKTSEAQAPISGHVAMRLTINADGRTSDVRVVRSSGSKAIDNDAVEWMQAQIMRPVTINGEARNFSIVKEIKFSQNNTQLSMN